MNREDTLELTPYSKFKTMILTGSIAAGTRITESFVAERLDVSRIPVREVIQQLYLEGFLERAGKNGFQVTTYDEQDIIDLYNYREALDGMLVRLFAQRADPSQIYYLQITVENLREILADFDATKLMRNDLDFHQTIARGSKNKHMQNQHEIILEKVIYIAQSLIRFGEDSLPGYHDIVRYEDTYDEHAAILAAIKAGDPDLAEQQARESVRSGLKKTLQILALKRQTA